MVELSSSLSSISAMPAVRFLVDLEGGLSSGVNGVFEPRDGLRERRWERVDVLEERRLVVGVVELLYSAIASWL